MKIDVAIIKCESYEHVNIAVTKCLEHLGGIKSFVKKGDRTLLKVNLVSARNEKEAVTTNSAIIAAVIKEVRKAGGIPFVGDSPALTTAEAVAKKSGIKKICDDLNVTIVNLDNPVNVANKNGKLIKSFRISKRLSEFDVIINMPKLKTHCFTTMSGAVKNTFGCIPGTLKASFHLKLQDPVHFSDMLLDLNDTIRPNLTIMDAVIGMEGPGPGAGYPRKFGFVIAGESSAAVDAVCAKIMGFSEKEVPTVWLAKKRGNDEADLKNIIVKGVRINDVIIKNLKKPRASAIVLVPRFMMNYGKNMLTARPILLNDKCIECANCKKICAAKAITMTEAKPRFMYNKCIRCYCCHEICPVKAIDLKKGMLAGIFGKKTH